MFKLFTVQLFITISTIPIHNANSLKYNVSLEKELYKKLFEDYNKYILPRSNDSSPLLVDVTVFLLYLDDVDIKSQTYTARTFFRLEWTDCFLTWDTKLYPRVDVIRAPIDTIWAPALHIEGTVGRVTDYGQNGVVAEIFNNGQIALWPSKDNKVSCLLDIHKYPFDEQNCEFDISSWTYSYEFVSFSAELKQIDLSMYIPNGEWRVETKDVYYYTTQHDNTTGYRHIVFPFTLHRKWQFVVLNTLFPTVCTSLLTLLCFLLPNESGERVCLSISIFLTLAVFMTVTSADLPRTADSVSLLGAYIALQLAWSAMAIVLTVGSMAISGGKQTIPNWIYKLLKHRRNKITNTKVKNQIKESIQEPSTDFIPQRLEVNGETDANSVDSNNEEKLYYEYISTKFNDICFYCCLLWHFSLHVWLLVQIHT